jgi:hypothetical protein
MSSQTNTIKMQPGATGNIRATLLPCRKIAVMFATSLTGKNYWQPDSLLMFNGWVIDAGR